MPKLTIFAFDRMPGSTWSGRDAEHLAGGGRVHVLAAGEDVAQHLLARRCGRGCAARPASSRPTTSLLPGSATKHDADLAAELGADRDVLEVRVGARQAAGGRGRLVEGRVQAAGLVGDQLGQRVEVGRLELRVLAPLLDLGDDLVLASGSPGARARRSRSRSCRGASWSGRACRTGSARAAAASRS